MLGLKPGERANAGYEPPNGDGQFHVRDLDDD
jgi:hypothetical protein